MKEYISPELEVVEFETEDIMLASGVSTLGAWDNGWFEIDAWQNIDKNKGRRRFVSAFS